MVYPTLLHVCAGLWLEDVLRRTRNWWKDHIYCLPKSLQHGLRLLSPPLLWAGATHRPGLACWRSVLFTCIIRTAPPPLYIHVCSLVLVSDVDNSWVTGYTRHCVNILDVDTYILDFRVTQHAKQQVKNFTLLWYSNIVTFNNNLKLFRCHTL